MSYITWLKESWNHKKVLNQKNFVDWTKLGEVIWRSYVLKDKWEERYMVDNSLSQT